MIDHIIIMVSDNRCFKNVLVVLCRNYVSVAFEFSQVSTSIRVVHFINLSSALILFSLLFEFRPQIRTARRLQGRPFVRYLIDLALK